VVASKEWKQEDLMQPMHLRYEGRKVMVWDEKGTEVRWGDGNDAPRRG
jgi:hypothetical protein